MLKFLGDRLYKGSAIAEMGDHLAAINKDRKVGAVVSHFDVWAQQSSPLFGPCLLYTGMSISVLDPPFLHWDAG